MSFPPHSYLLLHDHDYLWAGDVGSQTLDQFWVVKTFHQLNFLASCCLILSGPGLVELPCKHLACLFMGQPEHFPELATGHFVHKQTRNRTSVWKSVFSDISVMPPPTSFKLNRVYSVLKESMLTLPAAHAHCSGPWLCAQCQQSLWRSPQTLPLFPLKTGNRKTRMSYI